MAGKTFLSMVTRWSRSTSNFCTLIGQNLTDEFKRKIYAASWKLFTLTAKADGVLCQLLMFLTVFLHWMYKMKYSCYQESSVIHGWFVYWVLVEKCVACQNWVIRFRMGSFSSFTLLNAWEGLKVWSNYGLPWYLSGSDSRMVSLLLSNYCIWCLFLLYLISWSRAQ